MEPAIETILTLTNWMITYQMKILHPWSDKSQLALEANISTVRDQSY